jgi:uncharacterized protein (TIGR03437 family)
MISRAPFYFVFLLASGAYAQQYVISTVAGGGTPPTPMPAARASIGDPSRVAVDGRGIVYFGSLHSVFRVDRSGTLTRVAGNGRAGYSGDGGPATNAQLQLPDGIAADSAGNLYIADKAANVIRMVAGGVITTYAGNGTPGYSGDGGPATAAQLNSPSGVALDASGSLYVADTANAVVRKIANGTIATVAGTGTAGYNGDGVPAVGAMLNVPQGVAVDAGGNLYIADTANHRIRQVSPDGTISTAAGTGLATYSGDNVGGTGITTSSGDNGPATKSSVVLPTAVAVDAAGNLYIADFGNSKIRVVSRGVIKSVAGNQDGEAPLDGQTVASIRLNGPTGVAVDPDGNVYLTEGSIGSGSGRSGGDFRVWEVSTSGLFTDFAGTGAASYSGDGASAATAQFNVPGSVAVDPAGNIYVADALNNRVRKITPAGAVSTVAGTGVAGYSGDGSSALKAQLNGPMGVAVDAFGDIFIADTRNNRIRKVTDTGIIYTVMGNGNAGFLGDGGPAPLAAIHAPQGVAVDGFGNLYVADTGNHRVRMATPTLNITTIAGNGRPGFSGDGAPAQNAQLNSPAAVAVDAAGNVYVADRDNNRVRVLTVGGNIATLAGNAVASGIGDGGPALAAQLSVPQGVYVDTAGNVFISDTGHNRIREVFPNASIVTVAGTGACCYSGDGGPAASAQINAPGGLVVDGAGNIIFADTGNNAIRAIQPTNATPAINAIVNAASGAAGPIAPGEVVVIYGTSLGPPQLAPAQVNGAGLVDTQLAGASVTFNGIAAPLVYASGSQVSAIVPYGISGNTAQVAVQYRDQPPAQSTVAVAAASPALFTVDSSGRGQVLAVNQDGFPNTSAHPTQTATLLTLFATGAGQMSPGGVDGQFGNDILARPVLPVSVMIGGQPAQVFYAASVPGVVSGIIQVAVQVPTGIQTGNAVPVVLQVGSFTSPTGATISLSPN